jgi:hypothetical protein
LWAGDCQTCDQPLADDGQESVLAVDQMGELALASVHHQRCRRPGWIHSGPISGPSGWMSMVSNPSRMLVLSFPGRSGRWAMMVTNPALEAVPLRPAGDGWAVSMWPFTNVGLKAGELQTGLAAVRGAVSAVGDGWARVTMKVAPFDTYTAPASSAELRLARLQGGLVWGVSRALHPDNLTDAEIGAAMRSGRLITGWVRLTSS